MVLGGVCRVEGRLAGQSLVQPLPLPPPPPPRDTRQGGRRKNNELHRPAYLIAA